MKNSRMEYLLQKKLDRVATPSEINELDALMATDRRSAELFAAQKQMSDWLKRMPQVEPPAGLQDTIMAALPIREVKRMPWWQSWAFLSMPHRHRFVMGFALGAIACVLILGSLLLLQPLTILNYDDLYGTAVLSRQFSSVERIDLTRVDGEISWNEGSTSRMVRVALNPSEPVTAVLQFSPVDYRLSHFYQESWSEAGNVMVLPNSIRVEFLKPNRFVFVISSRGEAQSPIQFKLITADSLLYSRQLRSDEGK